MHKRNNFFEIEYRALEMLLRGDDPTLALLRDQFELATLESRELTVVGGYVNFAFAHIEIARTEKERFIFGDVGVDFGNLNRSGSFLLCVDGGLLSFLEYFVYTGDWPYGQADYNLYYTRTVDRRIVRGQRDLEELRRHWLT